MSFYWISQALETVNKVSSGYFRTVGPEGVFTQGECIHFTICRNIPSFSNTGNDVTISIIFDQAFGKGLDDFKRNSIGCNVGIQRNYITALGNF